MEMFHLHMLRLLGTGACKGQVALKGGCNLRLFFGSARYSEDMDLDVTEKLEPHLLREQMSRALAHPSLEGALHTVGAVLGAVSSPKQTDTTQRWKAEVRVPGRDIALHTKIEFSRRAHAEGAVLEGVDRQLVQAYQMPPLLVRHYPLDAAIRQKVGALVGRRTVQARDVFDLALLFARAGGGTAALSAAQEVLPRALDRAMDVSFDEYQGQVVAYLHPDQAAMYASREAWNLLQEQVVETLERALHERD